MGNQRDHSTSSNFTTVVNNGESKVTCKHCEKWSILRHIPRMKKHLLECGSVPASVKKNIPEPSKAPIAARCPSSASQGSVASGSASLDDQVIKLSKKKIEEMRELGALFIFTSGASFNVASNKYLKKLFKEMALPILIPERRSLSRKYLPLLYQKVKGKNMQQLKGKRHRSTTLLIPASFRR